MAQFFQRIAKAKLWQNQRVALSLAVLVLVGVLPIALYSIGIAWMFIDRDKKAVEEKLVFTTRALGIAVDRILLAQLKGLEVIGSEPALKSGDCKEIFTRITSLHRAWVNLVLVDPESKEIMCSAAEVSEPRPKTSVPEAVDKIATTGKSVIVGAFSAGSVTKQPIILMMAPVHRDGHVRYIIGATFDPVVISAVFKDQQVPPSWTGAIVDTNMRLAGRSRQPETFVGRPATPSLANRIAASTSGLFEALNQEGWKVYTVFSRSEMTGWSMVIGIPAEEIDAPQRRIAFYVLLTGGLLVVLALGLTIVIGRTIVVKRQAYEDALNAKANELAESNVNLARSNADLERFAYVASHDLQTPLRTITNYTQLLERRYRDRLDADAGEYVAFIVDSAKRMSLLIRDLLEYARVSSQGKPLTSVDASRACESAVENLKSLIDDAGAEVVAVDLPRVNADELQLISLFQNLIGNAIKYRHPERPPKIVLTAQRLPSRKWRISVTDNGSGIQEQYFGKIFEIFQRLQSDQNGTGLGLAISQRIVVRFGGEIGVESVYGQGSRFWFTISPDKVS